MQTPPIITTIAAAHAWTAAALRNGRRIGLVPTMGALHEGHISLVRRCAAESDQVLVTIFVNPLQFGANEDLASYPRPLESDIAKAAAGGATAIFAPSPETMYSGAFRTTVAVAQLTARLCGESRPGHFAGVTTVVSKLFNLFYPHVAIFGEKDFQQLVVLKRLAADLGWPVTIIGAPIVRESDGLALSSRNAYLSAEQRRDAPVLVGALRDAVRAVSAGERDAEMIRQHLRARITASPLRLDYADVVDAETLEPLRQLRLGARAIVAAYAGSTRLIDNMALL